MTIRLVGGGRGTKGNKQISVSQSVQISTMLNNFLLLILNLIESLFPVADSPTVTVAVPDIIPLPVMKYDDEVIIA